MQSILVVDDEQDFGQMLRARLTRAGYEVVVVTRAESGLARLDERSFDAVLCDVAMPGMDGVEFLRRFRERGYPGSVIMMSAYGSIDTAIECMKLGAYDYVTKPFKSEELLLTLRNVFEREGLRRENQRLREALGEGRGPAMGIIGRSPAIQKLLATIDKVAEYKSTVLVTGESGTGKEVVARAIHARSPRADGPFVAVNCGAIPEHLLESELFGHVRGAFTDATRDKKGMFEEADGGTLFLDEIGEMSAGLQVKLLRAIQEEEIRRVGEARPRRVDARIVAATIRNLREDVRAGRFREDLYYRLNVLPIHLPPLRERIEDIPDLVEEFMARATRRLGKPVRHITPEALRRLMRYHWPGNIRELENTVERACVFCEGDTIDVGDLPEHLSDGSEVVRRTLESGDLSIKRATRTIEAELIRRALTRTRGNRTAASKLLEISPRALLYKIKEYGIDIPPGG